MIVLRRKQKLGYENFGLQLSQTKKNCGKYKNLLRPSNIIIIITLEERPKHINHHIILD
jgi:hypothetical protein